MGDTEFPCRGDLGACLFLATGACPDCAEPLCDECQDSHACALEPFDDDVELVDQDDRAGRCSETCDGPGPDVADMGPNAEDGVAIPCPACGRTEAP